MQDFHFSMTQNTASPMLFLHCATGKHLKEGMLKVRKAGGDQQPYLTIKFTDVLVSSFQTGGDQGDDHLPVDHIAFNYSSIHWEYKPQKPDGSLEANGPKAGYDMKKMQKM
jgi:type VI secretion system secreted protein Hcp